MLDIWIPVGAVSGVLATGFTAWAALKAKSAADKSNATASIVAEIERQRRHAELLPRFRVEVQPFNTGPETLRLRLALIGPVGLDRLDRLSVSIRNDHFHRGEGHHERMGGPTKEDVKAHIWGPYRFTPGTGPDASRSDAKGRMTAYEAELPTGEELVYQLEQTHPGTWMTGMSQADWLRQQGSIIRLALRAEHADHGTWYLPVEVDTAQMPSTQYVPQTMP